jgi:hypothetical protein
VTRALVVSAPNEIYLARLRGLGAWWCLGSSILEPALLMQYTPPAPVAQIEARL